LTSLLEQYSRWHELLVEGYESGLMTVSSSNLRGEFVGVVVCGMGGSGVSGDFLSVASQIHGGRVPVHVFKGPTIPSWYSKHLVIAVSYSGNTLETLECSRRARSIGAPVIYVSSGGLLRSEAEEAGAPWVRLEPGLLPRAALPLMVGALAGVTDQLGLTSIGEERVLEAHYALKNTIVDDARPLAEIAADADILIVSACGYYGVLAERFRSEFSENSKILVKAEVYPESAHNDIVAWQTRRSARISFIVVKGGGPLCGRIMDFVVEKYRAHGRAESIELGEPTLATLMKGALIGGYASILLATTRGVNPAATPIIEEYKRVVSKAS